MEKENLKFLFFEEMLIYVNIYIYIKNIKLKEIKRIKNFEK